MNQGISNEYHRLAPHYDQRWAHYIKATTALTLADIKPQVGERILDLGCGTGAVLGGLIDQFTGLKLFGLDPVAAMLHQARSRLQDDVSLYQGEAAALPFQADSFDKIISASAWHYIRQPEQALLEVRRVLKRNGQLVLTDWCADYLSMRLLDRWLRWRSQAHYQCSTVDELRKLFERQGFEVVESRRVRAGPWWGLMRMVARLK